MKKTKNIVCKKPGAGQNLRYFTIFNKITIITNFLALFCNFRFFFFLDPDLHFECGSMRIRIHSPVRIKKKKKSVFVRKKKTKSNCPWSTHVTLGLKKEAMRIFTRTGVFLARICQQARTKLTAKDKIQYRIEINLQIPYSLQQPSYIVPK